MLILCFLLLGLLYFVFSNGCRTIDSVITGYGKGKITCFLANPALILDLIPADMVINSMVVAMVAHANQSSRMDNIYHVGSSLRNPINFSMLRRFSYQYFTKSPLIDKDGKPIKIGKGTALGNMAIFRICMFVRFLVPLKVIQLMSIAFPSYFRDLYVSGKRKFDLVMHLVELYKPYLLFTGIFDDINSERLRQKGRVNHYNIDEDIFNFDPKCIDWENYMVKYHIPGLKKYVIK